ncbi:MAG: serine hydrolase [Gemmatimonadaceae bacterium]|nr:serine hydrolase [Gemmatimonadaceae bacterium]MCW5827322.1 serine hydrolase [Gemmatimonadaceae bacterium]
MLLLGLALLVGGMVLGVAVRGGPAVSIGLAYKAKTLCSELFVSNRSHDDAFADLAIDDLAPLRLIRADVDSIERTVTSRVLMAKRHARFAEGRGCALAPWPSLEVSRADRFASAGPSARVSKPLGGLPPTEPERNVLMEQVLDEAFAEADGALRKRTRAVVVVHRGEIVAERYASGIGPETPLLGWSMTKSVMNALIGAAIQQGKLTLNGPTRLQSWSEPGDERAGITISDLLRMSSGLEFGEDQASPSSDVFRMLYRELDMAAFASRKELTAEPGTAWNYSSGTSVILSQVLRERLGEEVYRSFPQHALFEPLELANAVLESDAVGTFVGASYMYATAREWARIGQLYLQDGIWQDQRILPEEWVAYTRTAAPADPLKAYGAHFWVKTPAEYRGRAVQLPADAFHAAGHEAQFVTIVPSRQVVIVRMGKTRYPEAWEHDSFVAAVLAALPDRRK